MTRNYSVGPGAPARAGERSSPQQSSPEAGSARAPFAPGAVVLITLSSPREKFWGAILETAPAGVSVRGMDLNSLEDFSRQVREGEAPEAGAVFFPMHRVERIELDARSGDIPSIAERFEQKTGRPAAEVLGTRGRMQNAK